jgi:hypothetical protein
MRNKNFPFSRLLNPEIIPDEDSILRFIDDKKAKDTWTALLSFMHNSYNLDKRILYYGKKYGWAVQYKKKKKTIVTIFPERKSITVLLVFGKSELEKIYNKKEIFSPDLFERIENTKQYHDGKWLWLSIENDNYFDDIAELIKIKRKPDKD